MLQITNTKINNQEINAVSARELYATLELNLAVWARWSKSNIEENEFFLQHIDWVGFNIMLNGNETKDYMISLDFAKHISMQARTQKSHEMRNYFIECEKQLKDLTPKFANMSPQLQLLIQMEQQNEIKATLDFQAEQLKSVEHKLSQTDCSNNYYAITGFANLHGINVDDKTANKAGRKASKLCRERGIKIGDCGSTKFGKIGAYPEEILHEVFDILDI
jgi:phage anti-repressor protein